MLGLIFAVMLVFIALGMDIGFSMAISSLMYVIITQFVGRALPLTLIPQQLMSGAESFTLLAIPLFILSGELMNKGGITEKLVNFAKSLIGHLKGGLGHTCIIVNMIMAGMSGSSVADCTATGAILIPVMVKDRYPKSFAAALVASASTMGPIIPPSIPMILVGSIVGASVGRMFIGGAVPGILMGVSLMVLTSIVARKNDFVVHPKTSLRERIHATRVALLPLGLPIVILGGIISGITTPTESAVLGVIYSFILVKFVYKSITWKDLVPIILSATVATASVLFVCTAGTLFGWVVTALQLGPKLTALIFSITTNKYIILFIINIVLIVMGMFMATIPIILLMTPILFPLITSLGIDPIHFGVMMCLNLLIGVLTPPVGLHLYIAAQVAKVPIKDVIRDAIPMIGVLIVVLLLVTYFPQITLWLPNLIMR